MDNKLKSLLTELQGEQLSSVTFVQDYLQLSFDGPGMNVTNPITVESNGKRIKSWDLGFRDLLCAQIAKIVQDVSFEEDHALLIRFEDGSNLSISLRPEDYTTPEAVYGHGFKDDSFFVL